MIIRRYENPLLVVVIGALLVCWMLPGGCPQPQVPRQPADTTEDEGEEQQTIPDFANLDETSNRPTVIPGIDGGGETASESGSPKPGSTQGGTTGTTGGVTDVFLFLRVSEPFGSCVVRPGASVRVEFYVGLGPDTAITKSELLIARDNDADGEEDGDPVLRLPVTVVNGDNTVEFDTKATVTHSLLSNGLGRFVLGIGVTTNDGSTRMEYALGTITVDGAAPNATWGGPTADYLKNRDATWQVQLNTNDTSSGYTVTILLDPDLTAYNGNEVVFFKKTYTSKGPRTVPEQPVSLAPFPVGDYRYYYIVSDGMDPVAEGYAVPYPALAPDDVTNPPYRLQLTDRLIGETNVATLATTGNNKGAILQGFNFNDLAGSTIASVPDLDGDGAEELIIGSRYGKPNLTGFSGQGWGEAYLIYGQTGGSRLSGTKALNSVGVSIPGLAFRGIRTPLDPNYAGCTQGLSDITVVDDMDGDDLPELVFSFPRVESLALRVTDPTMQHPELAPDVADMGTLEYSAYYGTPTMTWHANEAQFTRGGIVIVSSHNRMLTDRTVESRKDDRVVDLLEIGQMFSWMKRPAPAPYIYAISRIGGGCADCEPGTGSCGGISDNPAETEYDSYAVTWDLWLGGA